MARTRYSKSTQPRFGRNASSRRSPSTQSAARSSQWPTPPSTVSPPKSPSQLAPSGSAPLSNGSAPPRFSASSLPRVRPLALTETPHPTLAIVPYQPLCLNDILSYRSRFDTGFIPDFDLDDFINVEMFTGEPGGFGDSDKDDFVDCEIHMDEEVVDFDFDVDVSESVPTDPCAGSECKKGDVNFPIDVDDDTDPVEKDVATQDTTKPSKRKRAPDSNTTSKKKRT